MVLKKLNKNLIIVLKIINCVIINIVLHNFIFIEEN